MFNLITILVLVSKLSYISSYLSTKDCPICPVPGTIGNFTNSRLLLEVNPVGNPTTSLASMVMQGTTSSKDLREFLVTIGLNSNQGADSRNAVNPDKVALYVANVGLQGTSDIWAINPLITQFPKSGDYTAQGIELDFNNLNAHRGESDAGAGLVPPTSYGLTVTGAGSFRSTSAILVCGPGTHRIWNRGITFANDAITQSTFQDLGNPDKSVDIRGNPKYGVWQSSKATKNYFAGSVSIGGPEVKKSDAALDVAGDIHFDGLLQRKRKHPTKVNDILRESIIVSSEQGHVTEFSGNVLLDFEGNAIVHLSTAAASGTVETNMYRYQLTPIGAAMCSLHVSREIEQSMDDKTINFMISGGVPFKKVSWKVTEVASE